MRDPTVSIIILTYNQINFVHDTLISALEQNYANLKVVVSDDGSSDGTVEVIRQLHSQYPKRLIPLIGNKNIGVTANANRALKSCNSKYIAFQGGDDILLLDKIDKQVDWLESREERVLCGHDVEIFDSVSDKTLGNWSDSHKLRKGKGPKIIAKHGVPFAATSIMVKASVIPPGGFDQRLELASEWKFWIDCLSQNGEFGFVEGVLARYRRSNTSVSMRVSEMIRDRLIATSLVNYYYPELIRYTDHYQAKAYYDLGVHNLKIGKYSMARALFYKSIRTALFSWKIPAVFMLSFSPTLTSYLLKDRLIPRRFVDFMASMVNSQK
jgi:glycosyltransferase involved in cell wall biosynthesis